MLQSLVHRIRFARYQRERERFFRSMYLSYCESTMIPEDQFKANLVIAESARSVEGCVVECGVWRGGMSAGLAEVLGPERHYYLFDSFEGLPPAKDIDGLSALRWQADKQSPGYLDNCAATVDQAKETMKKSPAVRSHIVPGWFHETLASFDFSSTIALLRLDGDWYESTITCLQHLFPKVASGGVIIIDDYYAWDGCARAVHDYLSMNKLAERIQVMPPGVAYITKRNP